MGCKHEFESDGYFENETGVVYLEHCIHCQEHRQRFIDNYFPTQKEIEEWTDMAEEEARKDIRTLCRRCMMEMHNAGYKLRRRGPGGKCDKCHKPGSGWEVK